MRRSMCKSKIHRATVTDANLAYEGSITLDPVLMEAADLVEYEKVHVVNIATGARFETYVITGARGSGDVVLNGAAARLVQPGDKVIIMSYAQYDESELEDFEPRLVFVDDSNGIRPRPVPESGGQLRIEPA
ncbi:MAG: aspartate 1-decarboxylase [Longimicrobiales bacterium]|nr:aspartate 1-decarboxylase [Longimicrobiales bacterium]